MDELVVLLVWKTSRDNDLHRRDHITCSGQDKHILDHYCTHNTLQSVLNGLYKMFLHFIPQ